MGVLKIFFLVASLLCSSLPAYGRELHIRQQDTLSPFIRISAPDEHSLEFQHCVVVDRESYLESADCEPLGQGLYTREQIEDIARRLNGSIYFGYVQSLFTGLLMLYLHYRIGHKVKMGTILRMAVPREIALSPPAIMNFSLGSLIGLMLNQPGFYKHWRDEFVAMLDVRKGRHFHIAEVPNFSDYERFFEIFLSVD